MRISKKLTAALAGALVLGTSTFAYADPPIFSLVPADPPLNGKVDCSDVFGGFMDLRPKNLGQELTIFKAFNGVSFSIHDAFLFDDFDTVGDLLKNEMENICNIGPNN